MDNKEILKQIFEETIKNHQIIESLVELGMQVKMKELAERIATVKSTKELQYAINELKEIQEAIKKMMCEHEGTINAYNKDKEKYGF